MDLLKLSTDWAKAEVFSAKVVWLFSILALVTALGFWLWGKTAMAKAFTGPVLIMAILWVVIGGGLFAANKPRIKQFETAYNNNAKAFAKTELQRTAKSQRELAMVFKILPALLIVAGLLILLLPGVWGRSIGITLGILTVFLMAVDSNTAARNTAYHQQLKKINEEYGR